MPLSDFLSVGEVLGISEWLQGEEIVPLSLSSVLAKLPLQEQVPTLPSPSEDDDDLALILGQIENPSAQSPTPETEPATAEEDLPLPVDEPQVLQAVPYRNLEEDDDDEPVMTPEAIMESQGTQKEGGAADIVRAWMLYHEFVVVTSVEQLDQIVTEAIKAGRCALDLETEGLDNRIYYRDPNEIRGPIEEYWEDIRPPSVPQTVHKIVGYCLCYDGHTGYYVPVRHSGEDSAKENIDPIEAGKIIKKLCLAAQPVLSPEGAKVDPLASPIFQKPPRVKIYFHHAKFDQEFLFPVTGIDYWHPDSFEDSLLIYYCIFTGDKGLGLKHKSEEKLVVLDKNGTPVRGHILKDHKNPLQEIVKEDPKGGTIPYKMIELKELFLRGRKIDFASLSPEEARRYACSDAICTFLHCDNPVLLSTIRDKKYANTYRLEKQVAQVLRWMERHRIKIDHEYVRSLFTEARAEADGYRQQILELANQMGWANFDPNSTQQLSEFLFNHPSGLNIEPKPDKNEKSGQYKTDADTLEKLVEDHPDINSVLLTIVKYRQVEKVIGTYLEGMLNNCDSNSELRYQFKQTGAPTGRFTAPAGDPEHGYGGIPIHGIPATYDEKKPKVATALRRAFVARDGYTMVKVDFAGEELRIVTNLSKEPVWIKEFNEGTGDLHTITAKAFFGPEITKQQRQMGKSANFSLVYGGGTMAIMRATKCTQQEAARRKANFDKSLPQFAEWVKAQKQKVKKDCGVFTAFGRWMAVPDANSPDKAIAAACERYSLNYPIQGSGADIMKIAMVLLYKEFWRRGWVQNATARFMLTVHDEIVFEVKHEALMEVMPVIEHLMTAPGRMAVPKWDVQLEVEPLLDLHWDPKYDYHKIMKGYIPEKGKKPGKNDIQVGDRWYQPIPKWLEGHITPDYMRSGEKPAPQLPSDPVAPPVQVPTQAPETPKEATPKAPPAPTSVAPSAPVQAQPARPSQVPPKTNGNGKRVDVFSYGLNLLTSDTVRQVASVCIESHDPEGRLLQLYDQSNNEILIDPSQGIRINPDTFKVLMRSKNL